MPAKPIIAEDSCIKTLCVGNLETEEMRVFLQRQRIVHQKSQAPELAKQTGYGDAVQGSRILSRGLLMSCLSDTTLCTFLCKANLRVFFELSIYLFFSIRFFPPRTVQNKFCFCQSQTTGEQDGHINSEEQH